MGKAERSMAERLRGTLGVDAKREESVSFQIKYGHTDKHMFLQFEGVKVDHLSMNIDQCDSMIQGLQGMRESFIKHGGGNG